MKVCALTVGAALVLVLTIVQSTLTVGAQAPTPAGTSTAVAQQGGDAPHRAVVKQYCVTCHNDRLKTHGLSLETSSLWNIAGHAEVWENVIRKLRAGLMPPAGSRRPDNATRTALVAFLEKELDQQAAV